jgi:hypothetical protein
MFITIKTYLKPINTPNTAQKMDYQPNISINMNIFNFNAYFFLEKDQQKTYKPDHHEHAHLLQVR